VTSKPAGSGRSCIERRPPALGQRDVKVAPRRHCPGRRWSSWGARRWTSRSSGPTPRPSTSFVTNGLQTCVSRISAGKPGPVSLTDTSTSEGLSVLRIVMVATPPGECRRARPWRS
jgi:hypothetical protein